MQLQDLNHFYFNVNEMRIRDEKGQSAILFRLQPTTTTDSHDLDVNELLTKTAR